MGGKTFLWGNSSGRFVIGGRRRKLGRFAPADAIAAHKKVFSFLFFTPFSSLKNKQTKVPLIRSEIFFLFPFHILLSPLNFSLSFPISPGKINSEMLSEHLPHLLPPFFPGKPSTLTGHRKSTVRQVNPVFSLEPGGNCAYFIPG